MQGLVVTSQSPKYLKEANKSTLHIHIFILKQKQIKMYYTVKPNKLG